MLGESDRAKRAAQGHNNKSLHIWGIHTSYEFESEKYSRQYAFWILFKTCQRIAVQEGERGDKWTEMILKLQNNDKTMEWHYIFFHLYKYFAFYNIYSIYVWLSKIDYKVFNRSVCDWYLDIYKSIMILTI